MTKAPTSAREAALKILLEDVDPLLQRAEDCAGVLTTVQAELHTDLGNLGKLVQEYGDGQEAITAAVNRLAETVKAAEAVTLSLPKGRQPDGRAASARSSSWGSVFAAALLAAVIAAGVVGGLLYLIGHDLVEQARVGRALQQAWPTLDEATRKHVQQVLR